MENTNDRSVPKNDEELADLFHRASRLMARSYHRRDHADHAQARVLSIIREKGSIGQRDLLEMLDVRSSSLSEVLGKLERSGQIVRKKNEEDKRSFLVSAAEEIQASDDGAADVSKGRAEGPFACLDELEREQLWNILEKIVGALKNDSLCEGFKGRGRGRGRGGRGRRHGLNSAEHGGRSFRGPGKFSAGPRGRHGL